MIKSDDQLRAETEQLITSAVAVLAGSSANRNRVACWIARSALELLILRFHRLAGLEPGQSTMRSRLVCLEIALTETPGLVETVDYTWARLSSACHHHAYQLDPSIAETQHLLERVRGLHDIVDQWPAGRRGTGQHPSEVCGAERRGGGGWVPG